MSSYVEQHVRSDVKYRGFNLLLLSPSDTDRSDPKSFRICYRHALLTNNASKGQIISVPANRDEGLGAISNSSGLGTAVAEWPKVTEGKNRMASLLQDEDARSEDMLVEKLFEMMRYAGSSNPLRHLK
jgi:uncharacterized protein with NRDE domain